MIESFRHKGLQELFLTGRTSRLPQERLRKIKMLLAVLDSAVDLRDMNLPGLRLHKLKAPPLSDYYSIDVTANYRIVFRFERGNTIDVNFLDTH